MNRYVALWVISMLLLTFSTAVASPRWAGLMLGAGLAGVAVWVFCFIDNLRKPK